MRKHLLFLTFFGCLYGTVQASNTQLNDQDQNREIAQVVVDGYDQPYCDEYGNCYYDQGDYDDVVWVGPGWYYGYWFNDEPAFWGWRGRHHGRGFRDGRWDRRSNRRRDGRRGEGRQFDGRAGQRAGGRAAARQGGGGGGRRMGGGGGGGGGGRRGGGGEGRRR